jgi:hypothetical protein
VPPLPALQAIAALESNLEAARRDDVRDERTVAQIRKQQQLKDEVSPPSWLARCLARLARWRGQGGC